MNQKGFFGLGNRKCVINQVKVIYFFTAKLVERNPKRKVMDFSASKSNEKVERTRGYFPIDYFIYVRCNEKNVGQTYIFHKNELNEYLWLLL